MPHPTYPENALVKRVLTTFGGNQSQFIQGAFRKVGIMTWRAMHTILKPELDDKH